MRNYIVSLLVLTLAACGNPDTPGGRAADARHEHFETLGKSFKAIDDQLKTSQPDLAKVHKAAADIAAMSTQLETWFPKGSSKADGLRTHALQAVWNKPEEFKQAAARFTQDAGAFNAVAQGSDAAAIRESAHKLGDTCKNCHDKFREAD